jgi:hypothetical protein
MKYLEELIPGDLFSYKNEYFILTCDFRLIKDNKKYLCISIKNGFSCWMEGNTSVEILDLYFRDKEGNIIAVKERKNEYNEKTKELH